MFLVHALREMARRPAPHGLGLWPRPGRSRRAAYCPRLEQLEGKVLPGDVLGILYLLPLDLFPEPQRLDTVVVPSTRLPPFGAGHDLESAYAQPAPIPLQGVANASRAGFVADASPSGNVLALAISPPSASATEESLDVLAEGRLRSALEWNLERDFRIAPGHANPNPDAYGNPNVWHFLRSESYDPLNYTLLSEFITNAFSVPNLQQWQGPHVSLGEQDKLPAAGINATSSFQQVFGIGWPNGAVRMHPWITELVIVGWRSPVKGVVSLSTSFTMLDPTCGNGILWTVSQGSTTLGQDEIGKGGSAVFQRGHVAVRQGDFLYFIVDPHDEDYGCDSTRLEIAITSTPNSIQ